MAHRNRWFTVLNSMVIFHGELLACSPQASPQGPRQRPACAVAAEARNGLAFTAPETSDLPSKLTYG